MSHLVNVSSALLSALASAVLAACALDAHIKKPAACKSYIGLVRDEPIA
jgi:outer membrane biogenesis lipoprotein LolB